MDGEARRAVCPDAMRESREYNWFTVPRHSGFTLTELIITLVIVGIISLVAMPRFLNNDDFDNRIFRDEVTSALRYAQKKAVASRRNVCVAFTNNSVTLTSASARGAAAVCDQALVNATGNAGYVVSARNQTAFAAQPANFFFDSQGQPSSGTQALQITGAAGITVNGVTGYVQ